MVVDLFQMRIASMEYTGWDTHNQVRNRFEANIQDIFGVGKGLDVLTQELEPLGGSDEMIYVFNADLLNMASIFHRGQGARRQKTDRPTIN